MKRLLEYTEQAEPDLPYGLLLVVGLLCTELVRSWSLALTWALNYRTGTRLRGAILTMAFHKILRLRSIRDKSMGQVGPPDRGFTQMFFFKRTGLGRWGGGTGVR